MLLLAYERSLHLIELTVLLLRPSLSIGTCRVVDSRLSADHSHHVAITVTMAHVPLVGLVVLLTLTYGAQGVLPLQFRHGLQQMHSNTLCIPLRPHDSMPMRCIALLVGVVLHNKMTGAHLPHERQHLGVHLGTNAVGAELEGPWELPYYRRYPSVLALDIIFVQTQ